MTTQVLLCKDLYINDTLSAVQTEQDIEELCFQGHSVDGRLLK